MNLLHATVLALVQGVTEFLPISSSAHLVLLPRVLGWEDQGLAFDIAAHTGTLLAVILYFRRDLRAFAPHLLAGPPRRIEELPAERRLPWLILLATVPVALAGWGLYDVVASLGRSPLLIASNSIVFGLLLGAADRFGRHTRTAASLAWRDALVVGLAQALAIFPGTSRAGVTMTAGMLVGMERQSAARFSFLLAIPVGLLAGARDLYDLFQGEIPRQDLLAFVVVLLVAAISAYLVIHWLLGWLRRRRMTLFVVYRIVLGVVILAVALT